MNEKEIDFWELMKKIIRLWPILLAAGILFGAAAGAYMYRAGKKAGSSAGIQAAEEQKAQVQELTEELASAESILSAQRHYLNTSPLMKLDGSRVWQTEIILTGEETASVYHLAASARGFLSAEEAELVSVRTEAGLVVLRVLGSSADDLAARVDKLDEVLSEADHLITAPVFGPNSDVHMAQEDALKWVDSCLNSRDAIKAELATLKKQVTSSSGSSLRKTVIFAGLGFAAGVLAAGIVLACWLVLNDRIYGVRGWRDLGISVLGEGKEEDLSPAAETLRGLPGKTALVCLDNEKGKEISASARESLGLPAVKGLPDSEAALREAKEYDAFVILAREGRAKLSDVYKLKETAEAWGKKLAGVVIVK